MDGIPRIHISRKAADQSSIQARCTVPWSAIRWARM